MFYTVQTCGNTKTCVRSYFLKCSFYRKMHQFIIMGATALVALPVILILKRVHKITIDIHAPIQSIFVKLDNIATQVEQLSHLVESPIVKLDELVSNLAKTAESIKAISASLNEPIEASGQKTVELLEKLNNVALSIQTPIDKLNDLLLKGNETMEDVKTITSSLELPVQTSSQKTIELIDELKNVAQHLHSTCDTIELVQVRKKIGDIATGTGRALCCLSKPKVKPPTTHG
jgi:methyl-accepting chemotaxis protein